MQPGETSSYVRLTCSYAIPCRCPQSPKPWASPLEQDDEQYWLINNLLVHRIRSRLRFRCVEVTISQASIPQTHMHDVHFERRQSLVPQRYTLYVLLKVFSRDPPSQLSCFSFKNLSWPSHVVATPVSCTAGPIPLESAPQSCVRFLIKIDLLPPPTSQSIHITGSATPSVSRN